MGHLFGLKKMNLGIDLEDTMLSEINQAQKDKYHIASIF